MGISVQVDRRLITLVVPARNEVQNLPRAYDEITEVMGRLDYDYEVLLIDNDSSDGTGQIAQDLAARDGRWRYLKFSRNFHVEGSLAAGFQFARGDAVIVLFSDLQDPPELIPEFVRKWEAGSDVVYGVVRHRGDDPLWRSLCSRVFYRMIHSLADVEIIRNATDYRLLSRRAIDAMNQCGERNRYGRGLAHWIGFQQTAIPYDRRPRRAGTSKAHFLYALNLAANAITSFSIRPLQMFAIAGFCATLATAALATVSLLCWACGWAIPGLTTVYILLLANLAVVLLGFGTVGEYVGRIYIETKGRPLFLIEIDSDPGRGRGRAPVIHGDSVRHSA